MDLFYYFLAGMFMFNSLPHLISGVMGNTHMTPFGKKSSAMTNVLWGFINILISLFVLGKTSGGYQIPQGMSSIAAFVAGGFVLAIMAASLFSNPKSKMPWWKK